MLGLRRFDEGATTRSPQRIETNRNELEALAVQFVPQHLPHGQVTGAPSIRGPGVEQDLLSAQARQAELVALEVGKAELRCLCGRERAGTDVRRTERPQIGALRLHERHTDRVSDALYVDRITGRFRQRNTDIALTGTFG